MALDSKNPYYNAWAPFWRKMRHAYGGETSIKAADFEYLPATPGQIQDNAMGAKDSIGYYDYSGYKMRAVYPSFVSDSVRDLIGVMHQKPPTIELPPALEPLRERATLTGESIELLLRRINEQQLVVGRIGLMLDLPNTPGTALPYIATYHAENIYNWDNGTRDEPTLQTLNLVVLNETEEERGPDFEWTTVEKYRVLVLGDPRTNESDGFYRQGVFRDTSTTFTESDLIEPQIRGTMLDQIPFIFINATDLLSEPVPPPLLPLAEQCLTIYRAEADRRHNLFMQAQDTLVVVGGKEGTIYRVGAGAALNIPAGGDAKFIGVSSAGLTEQGRALENDYRRAQEMSGSLIDTVSRQKESGEALRQRVAAQTATLHQIAMAAAEGVQNILRMGAEWIGVDPEAVIVTPNLEFADRKMSALELLQLAQAKEAGLPISDESIHAKLVEDEYTVMEFKDEMELIEEEKRANAERQAQMFNAGMIEDDGEVQASARGT
jgi:Domain of unknown function (DUF4055)